MSGITRLDVKPAFAEGNVPVALATDENYLPYLKVAINSAIARSPRSNLDIIVLHADIPEDAILDFTAGHAGVGNASVRFVDISDELVASGLADYKQTARLPLSACYRLLLPRVLAAYDKIVYLDVDVAVCRDLGELYAIDVGDNWFAAAKDVVYTTKLEYVSWAAKWGFAEWDGYVNTGVLVMNLERFRREPVFDRLLPVVLEASKWLCDQDALNFVCKGAIAPLDPRWNVQLGDYCLEKQIALTGEEMWIAHFTGGEKPWKYPVHRYSHLWWRHAAEPDVSRLWTDAWGEALVQPVAGVPKVSVVIPVYNSARYLPEALASVLMQKDIPEIEAICIDDGSTDDSAAILEFWQARDSRLKIIHQKNQGPGVARNAGIDAARGEYICFLDADDRLSSGAALLQAYEQAKTDNLDILIANGSTMAESGIKERPNAYLTENFLPSERVFEPEALGGNLYLVSPMSPWAKLYRRLFFAENKLRFPSLRRSEDFPMVQLALSLSRRIGVMHIPVVDRRIGVSTSLESTKDETPLLFLDDEKIFRDSMKRRGLFDKFRAAADISLIRRLAYNLGAVRQFKSFVSIAEKIKDIYKSLRISLGNAVPQYIVSAVEMLDEIVDNWNKVGQLAEIFVSIQGRDKISKLEFESEVTHAKERYTALEAKLKDAQEAVGRRNAWVDEAKAAVVRRDAKIAALEAKLKDTQEAVDRRNTWVSEARSAVARRDEWLNAEKLKVASYCKDLTRERQVNAQMAERIKYLESVLRQISALSN